MGRYRVVWPDLARQLAAVPLVGEDDARLVPLNSCYVIRTRGREAALALAAWLNSTWLRALAKAAADRASSGFARFNARVVHGLPLPDAVLADEALPRLAESAMRGEDTQWQIDARCAELLGLSESGREALLHSVEPHSAARR
jgi:hypothetical protein